MAILLRIFLLLMFSGIVSLNLEALGFISLPWGHIPAAIIIFLISMFIQALVMFYFIGTAKLVDNIFHLFESETDLKKLFKNPPSDLSPYKKTVVQFHHQAITARRQTVPWAVLMLALGSFAFLLGGAFDTGLVEKTTHSGVAYGFLSAMVIGTVRQWYYLGKNHLLLRKLKALFEIPDKSM